MKGNWLLLAGALAVAGNLLAATEVVVDLKTEVSPANPAFDACTFHGKTDKANPAAYRVWRSRTTSTRSGRGSARGSRRFP